MEVAEHQEQANNSVSIPSRTSLELPIPRHPPSVGCQHSNGSVGCGNSSSRNSVHRNSRSGVHSNSVSETPTAYRRSYSLTEESAPPPPKKMEVSREVQPSHARPDWNSHRSQVDASPKEKLPRINVHVKNKYDFLYNGKSVTDAKKTPYQRHMYDDFSGFQRDKDAGCSPSTQYKRGLVEALRRVDFASALAHYDRGDKDSVILKNAELLFEVLAMRTTFITPEMLHEHFLLCTPPGVAPYEAYDFLKESCEGKKELSFPCFLQYGDKLRDRVFAYDNFVSLEDSEKIAAIAERVLKGASPSPRSSEARHILIKALENQEEGHMTGEVRPMRLYELLFLADMQRKAGRPGALLSSKAHRKLSSSATNTAELPAARKKSCGEEVSWEGEHSKRKKNNGNCEANKINVNSGSSNVYPTEEYVLHPVESQGQLTQGGSTRERKSKSRGGNTVSTTSSRSKRNPYCGRTKGRHATPNKHGASVPKNVDDEALALERFDEACDQRHRKDDALIQTLEKKYVYASPKGLNL
ncbi:hypothetical protein DQ04_01351060 [Trypanosoma grayi]|uniref:hypothetical protein n=1 Tax=Trypanosoma grayi TaxID=71804 RepID=UPI0004F3F79C|nr:hypothetical protein DQ04_01351060 [Trypanosoma grayi]KEG12883.1 hypothetical protein DQ04_01351060 [Trypanosoma grayi]